MAPKSDEQYKKIRDDRYEEISKAALKLFGTKGFAATKISDITSAIGLSHGLFYHYFDSKGELYVSLIMNVLDQFIDMVNEAEQQKETPQEQLTRLTKNSISGSLNKGLYNHIIVIQAFHSESTSEEIKSKMGQKYNEAMEGIARIIAAGQREGSFIDGDVMELAIYHLSLINGLTLWNAKGFYPINVSVEKVMRQIQAPISREKSDFN